MIKEVEFSKVNLCNQHRQALSRRGMSLGEEIERYKSFDCSLILICIESMSNLSIIRVGRGQSF